MNLLQLLFYVFAGITIIGALGVLLARNILYAAFSLVACLLGIAALYVLAAADFLAITQIMIYVGGVLVLIIFGIMLTSKTSETYLVSQTYNRLAGLLTGGAMFVVFILAITQANFSAIGRIQTAQPTTGSSLSGIGIGLMTHALLPFEIAGILILAALMGAAYIAGRK
nr:NADH-quinone oxidoreductase subunit J [Rhodocytophaga rosea]